MQTPLTVNPVPSSPQGYARAEQLIFTCSITYTSPKASTITHCQKQDAGLGGHYIDFLTWAVF